MFLNFGEEEQAIVILCLQVVSSSTSYPGDQVLADHGFTVEEGILMAGAELVKPTAAKGKAQMTSILSKVIPIAIRTGGFDDVLTVRCAIIKRANFYCPTLG